MLQCLDIQLDYQSSDYIITSYVIRHNANIAHKWKLIIVENKELKYMHNDGIINVFF